MSIRLKCRGCGTAFVTADDRLGATVACPKCGTRQAAVVRPARPEAPAEAPKAATTTWVAPAEVDAELEEERSPGRAWRIAGWAFLALVPLVAVGGLVAWPTIQDWWQPRITDPALKTAHSFLQAIVKGDTQTLRTVSTVAEPPAIRSFGQPRLDPARKQRIKGSFAPIARLHEQIDQKFTYDPELGRYQPKNLLGPAAETLDALHEAKDKAEQEKIYEKMASGDPNDVFEAAESFGAMFNKLAEGALAPKRLLPTYQQLLKDAQPPLPPEAEALALHFGDNRETWSALLGRPFPTLRADGPFLFDRVEVVSQVRDKLASSGDPPSTLRLTLTRFQLEGIDTGWKVTSSRRDLPEAVEPGPTSSSVQPSRSTPRSPGEVDP
jgi:DNA-directed RNA polymerase subunit RPC12/RpoP